MKWVFASIAALVAVSPIPAFADKGDCNTFVHETNPSVRVEDSGNYLTLKEGDQTFTFLTTVGKSYGGLVGIAYDEQGVVAQELPYRFLALNGQRVLILQASVFYPDCK